MLVVLDYRHVVLVRGSEMPSKTPIFLI